MGAHRPFLLFHAFYKKMSISQKCAHRTYYPDNDVMSLDISQWDYLPTIKFTSASSACNWSSLGNCVSWRRFSNMFTLSCRWPASSCLASQSACNCQHKIHNISLYIYIILLYQTSKWMLLKNPEKNLGHLYEKLAWKTLKSNKFIVQNP
jgi:hypothetical protein